MTKQELLNYMKRINQNLSEAVDVIASMTVQLGEQVKKETQDDYVRWSQNAKEKARKQ